MKTENLKEACRKAADNIENLNTAIDNYFNSDTKPDSIVKMINRHQRQSLVVLEVIKQALREQFQTPWIKCSDRLPEAGFEVIGFNKDWTDEDFNRNGTRVCFLNGDDKYYSAYWYNYHDTYENKDDSSPTHWMPLPPAPIDSQPQTKEVS